MFVRFESSQLPNLKALFHEVYGSKSLAVTSIDDRFDTVSFSLPPIGFLAYPRQSVQGSIRIPAAYYGIFPTNANYLNSNIFIAQSGDTMTHPAHRGRGLFVSLAKLTYEVARTNDIQFIFGFPSPMSYPGFKNHLGWSFPFSMVRFSKYLTNVPIGLIQKKLGFLPNGPPPLARRFLSNEPGSERIFENFLSLSSDGIPFIPRSQKYLDYKKLRGNSKFLVSNGSATASLKFDGNINIGDIFFNGRPTDITALFIKIKTVAFLSGAIQIRSYFSPSSHLRLLLAPFGSISAAMPFGYVNLSGKFDPRKLDLTFLDFDYF